MLHLHYILLITLVSIFAVDVSIACFKRTSTPTPTPKLRAGVAIFTGPTHHGQVIFTPIADRKLQVKGQINGFAADASLGVHIHSKGNLGDECKDAGGHWNPFNKNHGDLSSEVRHEGDLGNIATDDSGTMSLDFTLTPNERDPTHGYIGLALVVHSGTDDLGVAKNEGSMTTGNSGSRLTCAVIGLLEPPTV